MNKEEGQDSLEDKNKAFSSLLDLISKTPYPPSMWIEVILRCSMIPFLQAGLDFSQYEDFIKFHLNASKGLWKEREEWKKEKEMGNNE